MLSYDHNINYYARLGVQSPCSTVQIKKAFYKLALRYHPDENNGDVNRQEIFKVILAAYEILMDFETKIAYDLDRLLVLDPDKEDEFALSEDDATPEPMPTGSASTRTGSSSTPSTSSEPTGPETPPTPAADTKREFRDTSPSPRKPKPKFETYWTITSAGYEMTPYYRNIMETFDRARALYDPVSKAERKAAKDENVPFEAWEKIFNLYNIRKLEKEAKEKPWEEARQIANQLKKAHKEQQAKIRRADKARLRKSGKRTDASQG